MEKPYKGFTKLQLEFAWRLCYVLWKLREAGLEPLVVETWRSQQRQDELFAIGRTVDRDKLKVTQTLHSKHTVGMAADVCHARRGWGCPEFFNVMAGLAESVGLRTIPGDRAHLELDVLP
jgi:hypothetical protein